MPARGRQATCHHATASQNKKKRKRRQQTTKTSLRKCLAHCFRKLQLASYAVRRSFANTDRENCGHRKCMEIFEVVNRKQLRVVTSSVARMQELTIAVLGRGFKLGHLIVRLGNVLLDEADAVGTVAEYQCTCSASRERILTHQRQLSTARRTRTNRHHCCCMHRKRTLARIPGSGAAQILNKQAWLGGRLS